MVNKKTKATSKLSSLNFSDTAIQIDEVRVNTSLDTNFLNVRNDFIDFGLKPTNGELKKKKHSNFSILQ